MLFREITISPNPISIAKNLAPSKNFFEVDFSANKDNKNTTKHKKYKAKLITIMALQLSTN